MKIVFWIIGLLATIVVLLFALSNRQSTVIDFWPFDVSINLPLYLTILSSLLAGFLIGQLIYSIKILKYRRIIRQQVNQIANLERQFEAVRISSSSDELIFS
ncbi:MAG: LapA family protein [Rhodospirillaceae bacterium]|jgi:uncharacterized integral membrane protein|nr:LapA family protein [Rhodospirillaceae bacterium]